MAKKMGVGWKRGFRAHALILGAVSWGITTPEAELDAE
jgi:hypothetical protein